MLSVSNTAISKAHIELLLLTCAFLAHIYLNWNTNTLKATNLTRRVSDRLAYVEVQRLRTPISWLMYQVSQTENTALTSQAARVITVKCCQWYARIMLISSSYELRLAPPVLVPPQLGVAQIVKFDGRPACLQIHVAYHVTGQLSN